MEDHIVQQRKVYYQRNKEKMNRIARERYHKKKDDPTFYKNCLEKNQQAYYRKTGRNDRTPEEEEAYFNKIKADVKSLRIEDEPKERPKMNLPYAVMHEMFFA